MKINQFSITPTTPQQRRQELMMIRLLRKNEEATLTPNAMLETLLARIHMASNQPIITKQWLHDLLATPDLALDDWLDKQEPLTNSIFYLIALQLLDFEVAVDFDITDPLTMIKKTGLPTEYHQQWTTTNVIDAFYLLLNTHGKNGQSLIDHLTAEGFLAWTYQLPAEQKPLYFNGKPLACFDPAKFIREVVYIETDMDTDFDGKADLVKAEIMRPRESDDDLSVPVVFTASPYNQGTNDEWGEKATHNVNVPLTHKSTDYQAPKEKSFSINFAYQQVTGHADHATETFSTTPAYTLNNYLAVRGYAIVYAAGIGTKDSDGLQTCGSPEQTDSMKAVIEWLHGNRRAFTDRNSGTEIKANWCNGKVAMTGRSYLGTLATAVATTGVAGLEAIISEAAISSWYDYYRENGLVRAPGGFQGEDADVLADETFSRTKRPADYRRVEQVNNQYINQMSEAMDRKSGNYNDFWDKRNYRHNLANIKAAVMMVHGLNDTNVRPSNVKALYDSLQNSTVINKLILHQGQHIYINAFRSLDFSEMVNLWLANKLWGQDNHADDTLPRVLVQDNKTPETWNTYDHWTAGKQQVYQFNDRRLTTLPGLGIQSFNDHQSEEKYREWCKDPHEWAKALIKDNGQFSRHFVSTPVETDTLLRGTPTVTLRVASSKNYGMISARLVDLGKGKRLTTSPVLFNRNGLELGYHWKTDDLREFKLQKSPTTYKVIASGHINLQNRHTPAQVDNLDANQFVSVNFDLQPIFHRLAAGHQLGVIIYSTDYEYTLRGNEQIEYQLDLSGCQLSIPGLSLDNN
ncbi:Xaa-Pro dipeptidyl-peptidase [Limosilactobacillus sp. STM2_1]|uniref:Xaa-Pro dipeptidyl-peptidase n=1 Tax=Limosilactobacillus rudii TaxID=2759755 RepID=A0A7W3UL31_9LACO|nr:Xaa-Pro dipeptidyl-peptidase [Limosilactobacillus rudii]MBB1079521.1 Xaa-Pro dipeptidyl-peptidase [Limosilactobacillus rudii]MBB1097567.1 Xaa-Pro dipeptidyl-peptidase [Limosilactobacillus rudii]MCD7134676.1 Xaa-Pro dipeptidyl-peptidase [Limosilactobacillus rudii]